jgi:hypothetical protein
VAGIVCLKPQAMTFRTRTSMRETSAADCVHPTESLLARVGNAVSDSEAGNPTPPDELDFPARASAKSHSETGQDERRSNASVRAVTQGDTMNFYSQSGTGAAAVLHGEACREVARKLFRIKFVLPGEPRSKQRYIADHFAVERLVNRQADRTTAAFQLSSFPAFGFWLLAFGFRRLGFWGGIPAMFHLPSKN